MIEVLLVPPPQNAMASVSHITPNADFPDRATSIRLRRFVIVQQRVAGRNTFEALYVFVQTSLPEAPLRLMQRYQDV